MAKKLITIPEFQETYSISPMNFDKLVEAGELVIIRIGDQALISQRDVDLLIKVHTFLSVGQSDIYGKRIRAFKQWL